jgi:hypothetical protein
MDMKEQNPYAFKEGIIRDPEFGDAGWEKQFLQPAANNPIYKKLIFEGLYRDVAAAVGGVHDLVWAAATPRMVGREIIKAVVTKNAMERFAKDIRAYAWVTGEAPPLGTGARVETEDIKADLEISAKKEWSESFAEDAGWNALSWQIESIGKAIARLETEKIVAMYNAISNANLAGGAEVTVTDGAPTWAQITGLIKAVEKEDFYPTVIAMNPDEWGGALVLDQMINALYKGPENMRKGAINHTTLDITFVCSSLVTKTLCIDTDAAAGLLIRRDLTTKPYEDPSRTMYGVTGTERIGMKVLRTKAVARGTN